MIKLQDGLQRFVPWNIPSAVMQEMKGSNWQPRQEQLARWRLWGTKAHWDDAELSFVRSEWPDQGNRHGNLDEDDDEDHKQDYVICCTVM